MSMLNGMESVCNELLNAIKQANASDSLGGYFDYLLGEGINARLNELGLEELEPGEEYTFKLVRTTEGEDDCTIDNIEIYNLQGAYVFTLSEEMYDPEGDLQFDDDSKIAYWLTEHGQHILAQYELEDLDR